MCPRYLDIIDVSPRDREGHKVEDEGYRDHNPCNSSDQGGKEESNSMCAQSDEERDTRDTGTNRVEDQALGEII